MKVLIAIDESEIAENAFDWYISKFHKKEYFVLVCHEAEQPDVTGMGMFAGSMAFPQESINKLHGEHAAKLKALAVKYAEKCKKHKLNYKVIVDTVEGGAGHGIINRAKTMGVDAIIMGSRGLDVFRRTVLGSVSDYVLHHADVPVLICQ